LGEGLQSKVAALLEYAETIDEPILSLAFSWLLSHDVVSSVIAGASNADQVRANANAVRTLNPDVIERLNELTS
jgi:aryl-alcohol dehydrogenase-like predicted oxidoreductase